ncbi:hypothetical protein D9Q98_010196 [Chlorella vulgaris]|uniref:Uncharacterized protein n=1 Tax=Chlorella vulgaris TaxID=3077 RepID=A0A9D4TNT8_CHLVU|nr:hypothetical protein D9Q98_010196 [Chlorella vulgaris]
MTDAMANANQSQHPLVATARVRPREDSCDAGEEPTERPKTIDDYAARVFGVPTVDTQGPAGSRVPDLADRPLRPAKWGGEDEEPALGFSLDPDAPPDSAGPTAPIDAEMADAALAGEAEDAAVAAVAAAHRQGRSGSNDMLDVLEAAEAKFDQQHATGAGAGADQQGSPMEQKSSPQGGQPAANTAWLHQHAAPPDTPRKAAISEGTREQMIEAIFTALHANPRYAGEPSHGVMSLAQQVEDALFTSCHSKQVYMSKVSNAVRCARTVDDAGDIPRIASGEPREVAEGHTAGDATPFVVGLPGFAVKPDLLM